MTRRGEAVPKALKAATLREGGFALDGGKVDLRFPTLRMAQEAHRRLRDEAPKGYWSIETAGEGVSCWAEWAEGHM